MVERGVEELREAVYGSNMAELVEAIYCAMELQRLADCRKSRGLSEYTFQVDDGPLSDSEG